MYRPLEVCGLWLVRGWFVAGLCVAGLRQATERTGATFGGWIQRHHLLVLHNPSCTLVVKPDKAIPHRRGGLQLSRALRKTGIVTASVHPVPCCTCISIRCLRMHAWHQILQLLSPAYCCASCWSHGSMCCILLHNKMCWVLRGFGDLLCECLTCQGVHS